MSLPAKPGTCVYDLFYSWADGEQAGRDTVGNKEDNPGRQTLLSSSEKPSPTLASQVSTWESSVEASSWKEGGDSFIQPGLNSFYTKVSVQHMPPIFTAAVWSFKSSLQVCLLLA